MSAVHICTVSSSTRYDARKKARIFPSPVDELNRPSFTRSWEGISSEDGRRSRARPTRTNSSFASLLGVSFKVPSNCGSWAGFWCLLNKSCTWPSGAASDNASSPGARGGSTKGRSALELSTSSSAYHFRKGNLLLRPFVRSLSLTTPRILGPPIEDLWSLTVMSQSTGSPFSTLNAKFARKFGAEVFFFLSVCTAALSPRVICTDGEGKPSLPGRSKHRHRYTLSCSSFCKRPLYLMGPPKGSKTKAGLWRQQAIIQMAPTASRVSGSLRVSHCRRRNSRRTPLNGSIPMPRTRDPFSTTTSISPGFFSSEASYSWQNSSL